MIPTPIPSDAGSQLAARWTAALLANGVFGTLAILILTGRVETTSVGWDRLLVGIAGASLLLLLPAVGETARWLRFRRTVLIPDPPQGSLGGHLGGSLRLPGADLRDASFQAYAVCLASEAGGDEPGGPSVHWVRGVAPRVDPGANGVRVTFAIPLPGDLPPTGPAHDWAVRVVAKRAGPDLDLIFPVPVARHDPPLASSLPETDDPPPGEVADGAGRHITIENSAGATVLRYRPGRSLGSGLALTVFGGVFLASGIFAGGASWQGLDGLFDIVFSGVGLLFLLLFGFIGGLLVLYGVWQVGNGLSVEVSPRRVRVRRSFFFVPGPVREWATDEIEAIESRVSGQQLRGHRSRVEYAIRGVVATGRAIPLGDGIQGPIRLERVALHLTQATGIPVEGARGKGRKSRLRRSGGGSDGTGTEP
jgi:hypothetical protein